MKRSKHSLSHYKLATFDMGQLIPISCIDILPGDSVRMATSALIRVSPLMAPVMHPCVVRIHHWFVPYRVLWDDWEDFITGGPDGDGAATAFPTLPAGGTLAEGTIGDYFGIPPGVSTQSVSALPFNAYNLIWNEFYRDQDLESPRDPNSYGVPANISWEKDYFTAARPWTQKGPDVIVPIGSTAPVIPSGDQVPVFQSATGNPLTLSGNTSNNQAYWDANWTGTNGADARWYQPKLVADLANAVSPSINDFRLAFALQRYQEARAQYGSRYTEYLRYLGVRSSDARLQRPEYLGGGRQTISFSEVLRTGNESAAAPGEAPIGEMKGHGIAAMRSRRFIRFFEEHGVMMSLASIRPKSIYADGIPKMFLKREKEDYWQKELEQIGQQEIDNREVLWNHSQVTPGFGFQDRYAEYRHQPSTIAAEFRSVLNDWHLARQFSADPALNQSFVSCVPSKRIHAEQTMNSIWAMFSHQVQARRLVSHKTIGRIL